MSVRKRGTMASLFEETTVSLITLRSLNLLEDVGHPVTPPAFDGFAMEFFYLKLVAVK